jgi:hypothetical protein
MSAGWLAFSLGIAGLGSTTGSAGGAGSAWASAHVGGPAWLELGVQQGGLSGPARVFTGVHVDGRVALTEHAFVRGGFVHQHETDFEDFRQDALGVTAGASDAITHRTGGELGLGWRVAVPTGLSRPVHFSLSGTALAFPDAGGPRLYGGVETLVSVTFGGRSAEP